ncbi:hypothetical protein ACFE04_022504 [Oxalis oulophora]
MTTPLTSSELNLVVFRYLQESGFTHSAFVLGYEAGIHKSPIDGNSVPPGALITFVQRGLQFLEMEANLNISDADEDFSFLQPLDLITKDVNQLQDIIKEKKKYLRRDNNGKDKEFEVEHVKDNGQTRENVKMKGKEAKEKEIEREKPHEGPLDREIMDQDDKENIQHEDAISGGPEPMDIVDPPTSQSIEIPAAHVTVLEGHTSEVCACAWSPTASLLASGSGDSTARIWTIPRGASETDGPLNVVVLRHTKGKANGKSKDVTTLDWNGEGTLLATGSYDGHARIWENNGELRSTLSKHKGPIFSLKWNKKGDYLLTGSCDRTAIVWDVRAGEWKQQFEFHTGPCLDVDWRSNLSFATSSTDRMVHVCKVGETRPIKSFAGHQGEVNCVKWDPTGSLLASCSDDYTAKIWSLKQDKYLHDLKEHTKEIYTIRWSPTGPGTSNPNKPLLLASASFDSTVKLWNAEHGTLLHSFTGHGDPIYSVAFSPNGEYLASGSLDKSVHIWSVKEGKIVKTYSHNGAIFEVSWNKEGDKIAACYANDTVCVLDLRM